MTLPSPVGTLCAFPLPWRPARMKRLALLPLVAALAVAACGPSNPNSQYKSNVTAPVGKDGKAVAITDGKDDKGNKIKVLTLKGRVIVPKGYKVGAVAPTPGSTVSVASRYTVKQAKPATDEKFSENPCEGVEVYLATQKGERFKGPTIGKADVKGEFTITNVPVDLSFLVMTNTTDADQRHAEMCAPLQTTQTAQEIVINYAGTLTTLATVQPMQGNALGTVNFNIFGQITTAVQGQLQLLALAKIPDVNDPKAIEAFMATVNVGGVPATKLVGDFRAALSTNAIDAASAQAALDGALGQVASGFTFSGSGSITPTGGMPDLGGLFGGFGQPPQATPAPTPEPTAEPTAEPSAAPSAEASSAI